MDKKVLDNIRANATKLNAVNPDYVVLNAAWSETIFKLCSEVESLQQQLRVREGETWICEGCHREFAFYEDFVFEDGLGPPVRLPRSTQDGCDLCDECWAELVAEQAE